MRTLQEVMDTMRADQEGVIIDKNSAFLRVSEQLSDCTDKLVGAEEALSLFQKRTELEWPPLFQCFETLSEETKKLKKCLKSSNIDDVIPFLEETRRCYKGGDVAHEGRREAVHAQLAPVYAAFRDIAMLWMKNAVGADKDYDQTELAEVNHITTPPPHIYMYHIYAYAYHIYRHGLLM
jgi:hypothetical protein